MKCAVEATWSKGQVLWKFSVGTAKTEYYNRSRNIARITSLRRHRLHGSGSHSSSRRGSLDCHSFTPTDFGLGTARTRPNRVCATSSHTNRTRHQGQCELG